MAVVERTYNIPLRKEWLKAPRYKRAKKAVIALKEFLSRHMKSSEIKIGSYLNKKLWEKGIKNPPHHVKVNVVKDEKGIVTAELFGAPIEKKAAEGKKAEKKKEEKAEVKEKEEKEEKKEEAQEEKNSSIS